MRHTALLLILSLVISIVSSNTQQKQSYIDVSAEIKGKFMLLLNPFL